MKLLIEAYHLKKPKGNMSKKILLKFAKFPKPSATLLLNKSLYNQT